MKRQGDFERPSKKFTKASDSGRESNQKGNYFHSLTVAFKESEEPESFP